ncbi:MAG: uroporphyrinogen-III synthase [Beijerinckiaceae bacterium]|nr:uroporphyrinogen-III synthase [Beijerinckiaceae bacterium]
MRVLVLRPADGARRTAARLAALGHEAISAPLIEPAATGELPPTGGFDALIATSAQAFLCAPADEMAPFRALPVLCVGARTAQAARDARFADIALEAPDAARLLALIAAQRPAQERYLYLAGRDRKPVLEDGLRDAGYAVAQWIVYEARALDALPVAARDALRQGRADAALHFSARSAEIFCETIAAAGLATQARALLHVAISPDAARGLAALAPPLLRIAVAPDEAHMLRELDSAASG